MGNCHYGHLFLILLGWMFTYLVMFLLSLIYLTSLLQMDFFILWEVMMATPTLTLWNVIIVRPNNGVMLLQCITAAVALQQQCVMDTYML